MGGTAARGGVQFASVVFAERESGVGAEDFVRSFGGVSDEQRDRYEINRSI